ncbi:amidohydrolase [Sphingomonas sp. F9_3S_D5_B_2]
MKTALLAVTASLLSTAASANTLITHVNGVQSDAQSRVQHFTGLLIGDDGKILRVLKAGEALPSATNVIDAHGTTVLPGLIDAHGHVTDLGTSMMTVQLTGTTSIADLQQRLRSYADEHKDAAWIIGFGWNQELWPDKRFPTAADLDAIVPDRPVVLERVDGHAIVANSAAIKAAGVTAATADPVGGKIERSADGSPAGLFVDNATEIVRKAIPPRTAAQSDEALAKAQEQLLSVGVTSVGSMSTSVDDWNAFRRAGEAGRLKVRLISYLSGTESMTAVPQPTGWLYGDHLRAVGIKLFADGALGSRGAWLKQPYADKLDTRGLRFHTDAELLALADNAASHGFQVATHAIGDAANAQIITVYEHLSRRYGTNRRWRIEHFQIVDPADIPRIVPAGIIASMQPTHQTSDRLMAEKRLGPARLNGAYAWQTVLKSGAKLAFGSDFPVESPNPFPGLSAGISRQDVHGQPPGGWLPSERLTLGQALHAFTRGGAYAGFAEDRIGSLEPGKWADFILVDRDPTKVAPQQLAGTEVLQTWIAGQKVWERAPSASAPERGR